MWIARWAHRFLHDGARFLYPLSCHWCDHLLPEESPAGTQFCRTCTTAIAPEIIDRCQRCSAPVGPYVSTEQGCIHCKNEKHRYQQAISLGPYQGELRMACLRCKRPRQSGLARALAGLLWQQQEQKLRSWNVDLVVPVPHHWFDRFQKDQASVAVAETLGRALKIPADGRVLDKVRMTRKQHALAASARKDNLKNAFRVTRSEAVKGRHVLLADDILTTGITADLCTQVLLQSGARCVSVAVLARSIGS